MNGWMCKWTNRLINEREHEWDEMKGKVWKRWHAIHHIRAIKRRSRMVPSSETICVNEWGRLVHIATSGLVTKWLYQYRTCLSERLNEVKWKPMTPSAWADAAAADETISATCMHVYVFASRKGRMSEIQEGARNITIYEWSECDGGGFNGCTERFDLQEIFYDGDFLWQCSKSWQVFNRCQIEKK